MQHNTTPLKRKTLDARWIGVGAALTEVCRTWSRKTNVTVSIGDETDEGRSIAHYTPSTGQIVINGKDAFGDTPPGEIEDLRNRMVLSRYPVVGGLAMHESMHAFCTHADLKTLNEKLIDRGGMSLYDVFMFLEETRVEGVGVKMWPADKGYLKASARTLYDNNEGKWSPRFAAICLLGRATVGVFDENEVSKVEDYLLQQPGWSSALLAIVRDTVVKFGALTDIGDDLEEQIKLAEYLNSYMPLPPSDWDIDTDELGDIIEGALKDASRNGEIAAIDSAVIQKAEEKQREREAEKKILAASAAIAGNVFYPVSGSPGATPPELSNTREPTQAERKAATQLARELEKAKYRDPDLEEFRSKVPPGRVSGNEIMRMSAAEYVGASTKGFKPFRRKHYEVIEEPPLSVGIICDVSGSMTAVQPSIGSASWIISEAVYSIPEANAAQVYIGNKAYPGFRKGERLEHVYTWRGSGIAYENFDEGFQALNGELDLLNGSGARILFVCSDGQFRPEQVEHTLKWLEFCVKKGVAVVWLDLKDRSAASDYATKIGKGVEHVKIGTDLLDAIKQIGEASVRALSLLDSGGG